MHEKNHKSDSFSVRIVLRNCPFELATVHNGEPNPRRLSWNRKSCLSNRDKVSNLANTKGISIRSLALEGEISSGFQKAEQHMLLEYRITEEETVYVG